MQRIWSNVNAAASHDPCAPIPAGEVYYNVAPDSQTTRGLSLTVGASTTFSAVAFSDGAMASWQIQAQELSQGSALQVSFDKSSVSNGDAVNVTVKLIAMPTATVGGKSYERFAIVSKGADGKTHWWPVVVYAN